MANIVYGIGISHAPGALGWPEAAAPDVLKRVEEATATLGQRLRDSRPDVIVAILDDHFENQYRNLLPTVSIGVADHHIGPAKQWLEALRLTDQETFPGAPVIAESLLRSMIKRGFDLARLGSIEYGNNLLVPWKNMEVSSDIPVIPVFINVFSAPLMPYMRALALGQALREAVLELDDGLRVAFIATGGLSHWPPFWTLSSSEEDRFLQQRMKRFQTEGKTYLATDPGLYTDLAEYEIRMAKLSQEHGVPLVNAEWDRSFLKALETSDMSYLEALTFEEVEAHGGHGGHEILNWLALFGAMDCAPGRLLAYEDVTEWICGMAYMDFEIS